jgi:RHS repeat-associated protein
VLTDGYGEIYEHLEFFAFGETWVGERATSNSTPYLYTSKELDETGLYYIHARYFDPRTSVWQSVDPAFDRLFSINEQNKFLALNSKTLNLYAYGWQNPVKLKDPDGNMPTPGADFETYGPAPDRVNIPEPDPLAQQLKSTVMDFVPIAGEIKSGTEAATGQDMYTGEELSTGGRILAGFGAIPVLGKLKSLKIFSGLLDLFKGGAKVLDGIRIFASRGGKLDAGKVNKIKESMQSGNYNFQSPEGRIGGWVDAEGNYMIGEGHHRMQAAIESGDSSNVQNLLKHGRWEKVDAFPERSYPMPDKE